MDQMLRWWVVLTSVSTGGGSEGIPGGLGMLTECVVCGTGGCVVVVLDRKRERRNQRMTQRFSCCEMNK